MPIPLLAAALCDESRSVMLAYGNYLQPVMERVVSAQAVPSRHSPANRLIANKMPGVIIFGFTVWS